MLRTWQTSALTHKSLLVLQLRSLDVGNNYITGTLPSVWSSLEQVRMPLLHLHYLNLPLHYHNLAVNTFCWVLLGYCWLFTQHLRLRVSRTSKVLLRMSVCCMLTTVEHGWFNKTARKLTQVWGCSVGHKPLLCCEPILANGSYLFRLLQRMPMLYPVHWLGMLALTHGKEEKQLHYLHVSCHSPLTHVCMLRGGWLWKTMAAALT